MFASAQHEHGRLLFLNFKADWRIYLPTVGKIWRTDSRFHMLLVHCAGVGFVKYLLLTCSLQCIHPPADLQILTFDHTFNVASLQGVNLPANSRLWLWQRVQQSLWCVSLPANLRTVNLRSRLNQNLLVRNSLRPWVLQCAWSSTLRACSIYLKLCISHLH